MRLSAKPCPPTLAVIRCVMHGALFDIDTGECVAGPCMGHGLQSLAIRVLSGYVLLDDAVPLKDPN